ncbi:glycoside hydrolase family 5 protein [Flavobacterium sp.]|uniref:glycoside hydrolase family 5 protein n=1 Tax=Flavobacterium sp. TaxID=239 RepID=UPI0038FC82F8
MKTKIAALLLLFSILSNAQFVKNHGQLKVIGTQLSDQNNEPISLRGVSLGWHNWWPRFYNKETVKWIHQDFKANVIRAAIGVDADENCYLKNPSESKAKLDAVVQAAIKESIYVIIDWHSHKTYTKEAVAFFTEVSKKYGKYPNVIYEIFNEPEHQTWEEVKSYSQDVIKAIRANDSDNIILVGNPSWDQDIHLVAENPLKDFDNIMYTMHFYAATHEKWLRDRVDYAMQKGIPVFVSESAGTQASGDETINYAAWQEYVDWMESKKISWVTWSISDKDETCSMLFPTASSKGKWKAQDLKDSGKKTKAYLNLLNNQNH